MRSSARVLAAALLAAAAFAPSAPLLAADDAGATVVVTTKDGMKLAATRWDATGSGNAGVVLLHMEKSDRAPWAPLVPHLRSRGLAVISVDLRGCGGSVKQASGGALVQRWEKRDPKLFAGLFEDGIAAVRNLVREGKCDAKRVVVVGAGVSGAVALDLARRYPNEVAAVVWMTPAMDHPGLDSAAHAAAFPPDKPLLAMAPASARTGADALHTAIPASSMLVYDDAAVGTDMLGKAPLVEQTIASFATAKTGSKRDDVVLDGVVEADGGAWTKTSPIAKTATLEAWAYRTGRRVEFGGRVHGKALAVRIGMDTHFRPGTAPYVSTDPDSGLPEIAAIDLAKSVMAWTEPHDAAAGGRSFATRVRPVARAVRTDDGFTFEGEWISDYGDGPSGPVDPVKIRLALWTDDAVPPRPEKFGPGAVKIEVGWVDGAVEVKAR